ncbi:MAG: macro domain-containing protein [Methylophilaceae bacterium]
MNVFFEKGNLFETDAEAIVNTVNCVGVMGKGVALEFKNRWPNNFKAYKKLCQSKSLRPGKSFIFDTGDLFGDARKPQRYLINFPTKDHWRSKSKFSYIEQGLDDLLVQLENLDIQSVALPPLGCGNGGLDWSEVRLFLEEKLSKIPTTNFYIYGPKESVLGPEYEDIPSSYMTEKRAILVKTIGEFETYFGGYLTRISLQKIVYFLQVIGIDYGMEFSRNTHGPYSEQLHKAFKVMDEKEFIENYNDDEPLIQASTGGLAMANECLDKPGLEHNVDKIKRLSLLIQGYESPFGMELLSSVHYLVSYEGVSGSKKIVEAINNWNEHKNNQFENEAIILAYERLKEDKFLS